MSPESEEQRLHDSVHFIKALNEEFKCDNKVLCTAINIYILFTRKNPFTTFNMYLACAMSHMIAAKIEYRHPRIENYAKFAHEKVPEPKAIKGKKSAMRKPFDEVKAALLEESMTLELDILSCWKFDFDFSFPYPFIKQYLYS